MNKLHVGVLFFSLCDWPQLLNLHNICRQILRKMPQRKTNYDVLVIFTWLPGASLSL